MAATVDLFPTISRLVDIPIPTDRIIDGVDMSPILFEDKEVWYNLYLTICAFPILFAPK